MTLSVEEAIAEARREATAFAAANRREALFEETESPSEAADRCWAALRAIARAAYESMPCEFQRDGRPTCDEWAAAARKSKQRVPESCDRCRGVKEYSR